MRIPAEVFDAAASVDEVAGPEWTLSVPTGWNLDDPYNCLLFHVFGSYERGLLRALGIGPLDVVGGVWSNALAYQEGWEAFIAEREWWLAIDAAIAGGA